MILLWDGIELKVSIHAEKNAWAKEKHLKFDLSFSLDIYDDG